MVFESVWGWIILTLLASIPVYLIISLKKFYGQGILKVVLKFLGISVIYNLIFLIAFGVVFFNALNIV